MAEKYDIELRAFPMNRENPFMNDLLIDKKRKLVATANPKDKTVVDIVTGEIDDAMFIGIRKEVDSEQFVKLYISQVDALFELSKTAQKVLKYFLSSMEFGDKLLLDLKDCMAMNSYKSEVPVRAGLTELLRKGIIARGPAANIFYANPAVFYKGDRLLLLTEYRRKKVKNVKADQNQLPIFDDERSAGETDSDS